MVQAQSTWLACGVENPQQMETRNGHPSAWENLILRYTLGLTLSSYTEIIS